jgi:hypothetical protein
VDYPYQGEDAQMKSKTVHLRDIRLYNNAGMRFPLCYANAKLLDLDKSCLPSTGEKDKVTCMNCILLAPKRYAWAYSKEDFNV